MSERLSSAESYGLGVVIGAGAVLQIAVIAAIVAALLGMTIPVPSEIFIAVVVVLLGVNFGAELIVRYTAGTILDEHATNAWNSRIKGFGPIALFALWWKHLRPRRQLP